MKIAHAPAAAAALLAGVDLAVAAASAYSVDSTDDIKKTAADVAWDMMQYYKGNETGQTPGILPGPPPPEDPFAGYYWWEAGAMWGTLIDYWRWSGDDSYNKVITQAMLFQVGDNKDYQPLNVTSSLGNDDQAFWGMTAMLAAENQFPDPPSGKPQWLALAQAVWETQAAPDRHDDKCGGGLHWQIPQLNRGYSYKNSIANGCFFNMGARLARYTGDKKYEDWAEKTWNWMVKIGFLNEETGQIFDGADSDKGCRPITKTEYSYINGVFAQGCAYLYDHTKDEKWKTRTKTLVTYGLKTFFPKNIATEVSCENVNKTPRGSCSQDMMTFKGYMHRWYATITQIDSDFTDQIMPVLKDSAKAAISVCTGEDKNRQCSFKWASHAYDGITGAGQQMSVLGAVTSLMVNNKTPKPVTSKSGGTSKGDPNAGKDSKEPGETSRAPITTGDKAGAGIITVLILGAACAMFGWMTIGA